MRVEGILVVVGVVLTLTSPVAAEEHRYVDPAGASQLEAPVAFEQIGARIEARTQQRAGEFAQRALERTFEQLDARRAAREVSMETGASALNPSNVP